MRKFLGNRGTLKKIKHLSFEPLPENKKKLLKPFIDDPEWSAEKIGSKADHSEASPIFSGACVPMVVLIEYMYAL